MNMIPRKPRIPSYRLHKPSGQAVATLNGRDVYMGPWGTEESKAKYERVIAECLARGRVLAEAPARGPEERGPLMKEIILGFDRHCESTMRPAGVDKVRDSLKPLLRLYGDRPAVQFDAISYATVRAAMIMDELCVSTIRLRLAIIKKLLAWAIVRGLIPDKTLNLVAALEKAEPLRAGQGGVKPSRPVRPVPVADVQAVLDHVPPTVKAMLELQLATGMRPGEVRHMTTGQIDRSDELLIYHPDKHKTKYLGKSKEVVLGLRAREIITPFLKVDPAAILFPPADGSGPTRKGKRRPGPMYTKGSYANAITRGCRRARVPAFSPNQIRHTYATMIRKEFGLEAAQVMLGHSRADVTQIYAEANRDVATSIAAKVG
jgi:integrase